MECHIYRSSASRQIQKSEEDRQKQRKRNALLLILDYLETNGYLSAAEQLKLQAGTSLRDFKVCDNMNLDIVLQDFETYYFARYQTHAKIIKKANSESASVNKPPRSRHSRMSSKSITTPDIPENVTKPNSTPVPEKNCPIQPLGPYSSLEINNEWRVLAEAVCKEILMQSPAVHWEDVIGHEDAKQRLKEALVFPVKYPSLYSVVDPWRGLFLYGPSGTGKTMLAKSAATECDATFFNVSPSAFTSKWRGESEKMVKVLFDLAAAHAPSIIFLDEVDSLMGHRFTQEHEASRRFKSELLERIEGLHHLEESVFVLAASNFPWDVDSSLLRRLEQKICISLPNYEERIEMLKRFLPPKIQNDQICFETKLNYQEIAALTESYSGSDLHVLSKEMKIRCIRKAIQKIENEQQAGDSLKVSIPVVKTADVLHALTLIKPVQSALLAKYEDFAPL